ncbi:MAG: ABC transporter ATP-binding protein [Planctomycetaceae bacterium]|nr:ABC transporter ATP-binding protein [Planctomycetaceae bacterium]
MPSIELIQVAKRFGKGPAVVDGLNLTIGAGELLAIVGPTGSGKTTLLRMLAGLEQPTTGDIRFEGQSVLQMPSWQRGVGYAFQHPALIPHQPVRKQLSLNGNRKPPITQSTHFEHITQQLDVTHLLDRMPEQLSGGERQRVALATVLFDAPQLVLLDEPLGHLDEPQRIELRRVIRALHDRLGCTMIYVTHDQREALAIGDRVAVLMAGRVEQVDTPLAVYRRPATLNVARFVGSPPLNVVRGTLAEQAEFLTFSAFNRTWGVDNLPLVGVQRYVPNPVYLGQRAETLRLERACEPVESAQLASLPVQVVAVEPQGSRVWLQVRPVGDGVSPPGRGVEFGSPWIVEIAASDATDTTVGQLPPREWRVGDHGWLTWEWTKAHWFDAHTGERLTHNTRAHLQSDNSKYEHPASGKETTGNECQRSPADHRCDPSRQEH